MLTKASLKRLIVLAPAALLAAVIGATPAWGAVALQNGFNLWSDHDEGGDGDAIMSRLDFDPATAGRELLGVADDELTIDLGTTVKLQTKLFLRVVSHDNTSEFGRLSKRLFHASNPFPDPGILANQEGGANETNYGGDFGSTTIPSGFTTDQGMQWISNFFDDPGAGGIAENSGAIARTLVISMGIDGNYSNATDGFVDVGRISFHSFNATPSAGTFNYLCSRAFLRESGDWFLESGDVGNFIPGLANARINDDEIRVVEDNDTTGFIRVRYYDPTDCSLLDTVFVRQIL